jgi:hypothetical protein
VDPLFTLPGDAVFPDPTHEVRLVLTEGRGAGLQLDIESSLWDSLEELVAHFPMSLRNTSTEIRKQVRVQMLTNTTQKTLYYTNILRIHFSTLVN